jgi:hypothetical protein
MDKPIRAVEPFATVDNALDTEVATSPRNATTSHHPQKSPRNRSITMARLRALALLSAHCAVAFDVRHSPSTRYRQKLSFLVQSEVPDEGSGALLKDESPRSLSPATHAVNDDAENQSDCLPPVIQSLVDERREYQLNLGRALDVLRTDMQDILSKTPGSYLES